MRSNSADRSGLKLGLDIVEFVMDVEAEFDIELPDEEFAQEPSMGRLCDIVRRHVKVQRGQDLSGQDAFQRVRTILIERYAIHSDEIVREALIGHDLGLH